MIRCYPILMFLFHCCNLYGQQRTAAATVNNYTEEQKHLLVYSTAKFIHIISQGNMDSDSVMSMACRINGLPFLLPYAGEYGIDQSSPGIKLINSNKYPEAIHLLKSLEGKQRLQLLIGLAAGYLHRPGVYTSDLNSAGIFLKEAIQLNAALKDSTLQYACLLIQGEYYRQQGKNAESKQLLLDLISSGQWAGNKNIGASAWEHLGKLHKDADSTDISYFNNALLLYQQLGLKEKEIELLWELAGYWLTHDLNAFERNLHGITALQQSTGFRHSLFVQYMLSVAGLKKGNYLEAMEHARAGIENMQWAGINEVQASYYMRLGVVYAALGKEEEALRWYNKGLEQRSNATHLFWFKSLLYATTLLYDLNRPEESLSLIQQVTREFPPATPWEKAQILSIKGACYEKAADYQGANDNYMSFLRLTNEYPDLDRYGEFVDTYSSIATFYLSNLNVKSARLFINKMTPTRTASLKSEAITNYMLFKIDSIEGKYQSAINYYMKYKSYDDSDKNMEQRKAFDELTIKHNTEKKDKDIQLLKKEKQLQASTLLQEKSARNWILKGVALLLVIVVLLVYNSRLKQRSNKKLRKQQTAIGEQNIALRNLVIEKEWLVKEIHHRVKNNLHTVMGLLGTQSNYLQNDEAINAINDSQRRIQSMSLIHQKLYQSNNLSAINMADYVYELVDSLDDSLNTDNCVRFKLAIEPVALDLAHCIPLGLILNEAITNSFKYAFPKGQKGLISIGLRNTSPNIFLLTIEDNGVGLPYGFDINLSKSMGMNLMRGLAGEIGSEFILSGKNGTRIELSFSCTAGAPGNSPMN